MSCVCLESREWARREEWEYRGEIKSNLFENRLPLGRCWDRVKEEVEDSLGIGSREERDEGGREKLRYVGDDDEQ